MSQNSTSLLSSVIARQTPHVLLVEDNRVALHFIEVIASQAGLQFTSTRNGEDALELAQNHAFDLIITDIDLPGISGYELTRAIRRWECENSKKPLPVFGLTARENTKDEYLQSGMNALLFKPITLKIFEELIKQYID